MDESTFLCFQAGKRFPPFADEREQRQLNQLALDSPDPLVTVVVDGHAQVWFLSVINQSLIEAQLEFFREKGRTGEKRALRGVERWRNSLREFQIKRIDVNCWRLCGRRRQFILSQDDRFLGSFLKKSIDNFVSFGGLSKIIGNN